MKRIKVIYIDEEESIIQVFINPPVIANLKEIVGFVKDKKIIKGIAIKKSVFHNMNTKEIQVSIMIDRSENI